MSRIVADINDARSGSDENNSSDAETEDSMADMMTGSTKSAAELEQSWQPKTVQLESSIYGATVAMMIRAMHTKHWWVRISFVLIFGLLIGTIYLQFFMIGMIKKYGVDAGAAVVTETFDKFTTGAYQNGSYDEATWLAMDEETREDICTLPFAKRYFMYIILTMVTMSIFTLIRQSFTMFGVIHQLGLAEKGAKFEVQADGSIVLTKLSFNAKLFVYIFVIIPKVVTAALIWWLGSRWMCTLKSIVYQVLCSSGLSFIAGFDSMVLDSVAATDVQHLLSNFKISASGDLFSMIEQEAEAQTGELQKKLTKTLKLPPKNKETWQKAAVSMICSLLFVLVTPSLFLQTQEVIPHVPWDVLAHACTVGSSIQCTQNIFMCFFS